MINLLDLDHNDLKAFFIELGEAPFRARQVLQWLHKYGADIAEMTNISKTLRTKLAAHAMIQAPEVIHEQISSDGTQKWLLRLSDGNAIETVFIPEAKRGTLCVSSQVGCVVNCSFCATATQGFNRNLSVAEIIGQVWIAARRLADDGKTHDHHITNVVMMGMGEPLLNFDNVVKAMNIMMDDFAYGLSKRRVTLSTSGLVPAMKQLAQVSDVALAVSLHAPNDALRNQLVPINKKYPLRELMAVCRDYFPKGSRRRVTFEYVMLDGINDTATHAKQLITLLRDIPCKVNLIPFNPFPGAHYQRSKAAAIDEFKNLLLDAGLNTIIRKTRGPDIDAACGQLKGNVQDRTRRAARYPSLAAINIVQS